MNYSLLNDLAKAGGGGWISPESTGPFDALVGDGLVSTDHAPDADGDVYYALTDTGRKWLEADGKGGEATKAPPKQQFVPAPRPGSPEATREVAGPSPLPAISSGFDTEAATWNEPHRQRGRRHEADHEAFLAELDLDNAPVGGSKHIAVTEAIPKPWLHYYRVISLVNKRFATPRLNPDGSPEMKERTNRKTGELKNYPTFDYSKRFLIYQAKKDDPKGPGARVKRVV